MPNQKPSQLTADSAPVDPTLVLFAQSADGTADYKVVVGDLPLSTPQQAALPTYSIPLSQKGAANGVATLGVDGKVPATQLAASPYSSVTTAVNEAAMLALTGLTVTAACIRLDDGYTYVLTALPASTLGNWTALPTSGVSSVDGDTGAVDLSSSYVAVGDVEDGATLGVIVYEYDGAGNWVRNSVAVKLFINRIDDTQPASGFTDGVDVFLLAP